MIDINPTFVLPTLAGEVVIWAARGMLGVTFLVEAYGKSKNVKKFAESDGMPLPVAYFITLAELGAAVAMLTGILLQAAAIGLVLLMASATLMKIVRWRSPFWASRGGWQYDLMLLILAAVVATS